MRSLFHTIMGKVGGVVNPLWNDLIGYYTSDNTPNTSIGSVNGTLVNGATYATGKINNAFSFDGVNDYVDLDDNYDFTFGTPFSISTWCYFNSVGAFQFQSVFSKINPTGPEYKGYQLQLENNQIRCTLIKNFTSGDYIIKRRTQAFSINTWYHVVLTYDGSKNSSGVKIYIDGSDGTYDVNTNSLTANISNVGIDAVIGCSYNNSYFVNGKIDETAIFDAELTSAQVTELYNSGNGLQYGASYGTLTTAWISATGETDPTIIGALNTLETDLNTYGLTSKMKSLYPFVGGTAAKHKFNFMDARDLDVAFRLTFNGGWTHANTGSTPNGTNAYANTYLIPSTSLSQNNAGMGFYNRTNTSYAGAHGTRFSNNFEIFPRWTDGSFYCYINDSGAGFGGAIAGSNGFIQGSRTGSNSIRLNRNTTQNTGTQSSTGVPVGSVWIGASNSNNITGIYFDNRELALFYISEGFNNTEMQNLYTAVQAFQTTLGRQV